MVHKPNRVVDLFRARLSGQLDEDMQIYGESIGVPSRTVPQQTQAQPPAAQAAPAGPQQSPAMTQAPAPMAQPPKRMGIPALDALSEMPRKRTRGIVYQRNLGRVLRQKT